MSTAAEIPAPAAPLEVHVVAHTHWDREWYHVMPRFRQRLVALIDTLLDPDHSARIGPFLLDGQGITLRDYLTVRPERHAALSLALRTGRLEAGPWFVLADNLIPSGEAIVRNLEAGRRVLAEFGAHAPAVAYCPDTFGHPAALPTIAQGFGLPIAVVWRGAGGAAHPHTDAFAWVAPDGSRVLVHHLPPDGYEYGSALPHDPREAAARAESLLSLWGQRNRTGVVLLLNGADHHALQPELGNALETLQQALGPRARVVRSTLAHWADAHAPAAGNVPSTRGELRDSYGYTWTLGGTLATRAHQKRANARLERGLLRDVEPWLALVRLHDGPRQVHARVSPASRLTMAQLPALLARAWEDLLATHPHDTLCGCSIDAVARSMDVQQELVAEQGKGLREAALQLALVHDPVGARARHDLVAARVVLRNRTARSRAGVAQLVIRETLGDVAVGPASADAPPIAIPGHATTPALGSWTVQPIGAPRVTHLRRESPQHYPDDDLVREHRVLAWVPAVPAFGLAAFGEAAMRGDEPPHRAHLANQDGVLVLSNGLLTIQVRPGGEVDVQHGDRALVSVLSLEITTDLGDSYTPSLRGDAERLTCRAVDVRERGPLRVAVAVQWALRASVGRGEVYVTTILSLTAGVPALSCEVRGHNLRRDHRLQLVWHADLGPDATVVADAAFGPVTRTVAVAPSHAREQVPGTMPMHRWATLADDRAGATLIGDGLAEAELDPARSRLALTLLRAIGELSRNDLPERPGHAGWPASTPDAQCLGSFRARTALLLHGPHGADTLAHVRDICDDVLLPLVGETWRDLELGGTPVHVAGPALTGEAFESSAVTIAQRDSQAVVLRAVNLTDAPAAGCWILPLDGPWSVTRCRLDETPIAPPLTCDREIGFEAGPREVVTFTVRSAAPAEADRPSAR